MAKKLSNKQKAFVQEYLIDLNATQAAKRAQYSPKTAYSIGQENLNKPEIAAAIQAEMDARAKRIGVDGDRVLEEIGRLAFSDIRKLFDEDGNLLPIHKWSDDAAAAVSSVEVVSKTVPGEDSSEIEYTHKLKLWDKGKQIELVGKHLKLFGDTVNVNVRNSLDDLSDEELSARLQACVTKLRTLG